MTTTHHMRADLRPENAPPIDVSPFEGHWYNTKRGTDYFQEVVIRAEGPHLSVRVFGAGEENLVDWGETTALPYVAGGGNLANGFHGMYDLDYSKTHLVANQKLGILVIQSYTSYHDHSGRANHYAREFFHRKETR